MKIFSFYALLFLIQFLLMGGGISVCFLFTWQTFSVALQTQSQLTVCRRDQGFPLQLKLLIVSHFCVRVERGSVDLIPNWSWCTVVLHSV